jgi:hypothetical protein
MGDDEIEVEPPAESAKDPLRADEQPAATGNDMADKPADEAAAEKSKSDWRTTLISAVAALLGALIGGVASYLVATQSSLHQADAALLDKRQSDYADYLAAETKLQGVEYTLHTYYERYDETNIDTLQQAADHYYDLKDAAVSTDYLVALVCSPEVDKARIAIVDLQQSIDADLHALADDSKYRQKLNPETVQRYGSQVEQLTGLFSDFTHAARATDLRQRS